jgi:hypothetical protein
MRLALCGVLVVSAIGCDGKRSEERAAPASNTAAPAPAPAPAPAAAAAPAPARALPLDPVRVEAAQASRAALELMTRAIACPQKLPSTFTRFCVAAQDFSTGTAAELPEGDTLLVGVGAIITPGAATVRTLGTEMPLVMRLQRTGASVSAKQIALRDPGDPDALPTVAARIGKTLDGKWDHVDVPAAFKRQLDDLATAALDPLEASGDSYWPKDLDGLELRRANGRWIGIGSPEGPTGRHVIMLFVDKHQVLAPKQQSPQQITVMHL